MLDDHAGRADHYGNALEVTAPAVADELAGAAELAAGKLGRRPFTVIRGRATSCCPPATHGPGAAALLRPDGADLFGLGAREAVVAALRQHARRPDGVRDARRRPTTLVATPDRPHRCRGAPDETARSAGSADAAGALGGRGGGVRPWLGGVAETSDPSRIRLRPVTP